jgi:F0F1-type ATP synthase delta subunit
MAQLVAKAYAEALMEAAAELGQMDEVRRDLGLIADTLAENPDFKELFDDAITWRDAEEVCHGGSVRGERLQGCVEFH